MPRHHDIRPLGRHLCPDRTAPAERCRRYRASRVRWWNQFHRYGGRVPRRAVWSPLAGGFLSGKFSRDSKGPEGSRRTTFDFPPIDRERAFTIVDAMRPIAAAHGVSVARVALAWLAHQPHVTSVIIGARTRDQLVDNLAATELKLGTEELETLGKVSALPPEYPGWMLDVQGRDRRSATA